MLIASWPVFLAYNANTGPAVRPDLRPEGGAPSGAKLVKGNEVRVGGFRVGVVDEITPRSAVTASAHRAVAT